MKSYLLLFVFCILGMIDAVATHTPPVHDFHISKCIIDYNESEKALQITMHLFIDDFEEALRRQGKDKLHICTEKESPQAEEYIADYLKQGFRLVVNGEQKAYTFLGKEQSDDLQAMWCYMEIADVNQLSSLEVTNQLLLEVFNDQVNIVQISGPGDQQGYFMFKAEQTSDKVDF